MLIRAWYLGSDLTTIPLMLRQRSGQHELVSSQTCCVSPLRSMSNVVEQVFWKEWASLNSSSSSGPGTEVRVAGVRMTRSERSVAPRGPLQISSSSMLPASGGINLVLYLDAVG